MQPSFSLKQRLLTMPGANECQLCLEAGGNLLWQDELCRLVLVEDADYPGFCRVIWKRHVAEMTDLTAAERRHLMSVVFAAESAMRAIVSPDKVNLASLGNLVPHLHWHVIPRWRDDRHFPNPIWGSAARELVSRPMANGTGMRNAFTWFLAREQGGE